MVGVSSMESGRKSRVRRLTLAPTTELLTQFPDLEEGESSPEFGADCWCSAPTTRVSADPLAGRRCCYAGSKFWPLAAELNSDEEELFDGDSEDGYSTPAGAHPDAVATVSASNVVADASSPKVHIAGFVACQKTELPGNRVADVLVKKQKSIKPWRGPLPRQRSSPRVSFGDLLAKANTSFLVKKSVGPQDYNSRSAPVSSLSKELNGDDLVVRSVAEPDSEPQRFISVHSGGRLDRFKFPEGLSNFFSRTGRLRTNAYGSHSSKQQNVSLSAGYSSTLPALSSQQDRGNFFGAGMQHDTPLPVSHVECQETCQGKVVDSQADGIPVPYHNSACSGSYEVVNKSEKLSMNHPTHLSLVAMLVNKLGQSQVVQMFRLLVLHSINMLVEMGIMTFSMQVVSSSNEAANYGKGHVLNDKVKNVVESTIDMAVSKSFGECVDAVVVGDDNVGVEGIVEDVSHEENVELSKNMANKVVMLEKEAEVLHGNKSMEDKVAPMSSPQRLADSGEHMLSKEKERVVWKKFGFTQGNLQGNILDSTMVFAA